ncbi:MAG TPA: M15 family metallopeptidase [Chthoniobacteraceae bacterium]|jgi:D-alanyl-D-alanine dipeptidase|nr:M15 family metallopeptidase [Chthoniobacteraceae bacterium]
MKWLPLLCLLCCLPLLSVHADEPGSRASEPLVDIHTVDPTIVIDLRYATANNVLGHPIYPPGARALVRQSVADRLKVAQLYLHQRGYGLKIWDAFRPFNAQGALWAFAKSAKFVADPENGHALHTWGVAVDATLVDSKGREVPMPSGFDAFTSGASLHYDGADPTVHADLDLLLHAMGAAGFRGMRSEWWHFVAPDWRDFAVVTPRQAAAFTGTPLSPAARVSATPR